MPDLHELEDDKTVSITMRKSEAIVVGILIGGALEQLSPLIPIDVSAAQVCKKASNALVGIKAAIDA
jgi:hypothetical protein